GLKWSDFDFTEDQVHIQRDIDFAGFTAQEGDLKTEAADRFVPIPEELKEMLVPLRPKDGGEDQYVFHTADGRPLSQATFKRKWCELMLASGCADWRIIPEGSNRPNDILKQVKPRLTPHFFRHNYVTMLYESGVDPLIAMKIVGHRDYQTTANVYTHVRDEMLKKSTVDLDGVFKKRGSEGAIPLLRYRPLLGCWIGSSPAGGFLFPLLCQVILDLLSLSLPSAKGS
ncbi:MAG: site-specific integrase, partial [Lachnospiraceae bacterium]|nr:site-specific integrase [Lachnospiraceae bacterium]